MEAVLSTATLLPPHQTLNNLNIDFNYFPFKFKRLKSFTGLGISLGRKDNAQQDLTFLE